MRKPLFSFDELKLGQEDTSTAGASTPGAVRILGETKNLFAATNSKVEEVIGSITPGEIIQFNTAGKWSTHELIKHLLQQTGPAKIYLTTWTITDTPVRMLIELIEAGMIQQLNCIFDERVRIRKPEALQLVQYKLGKIKLCKCHAKVAVIKNDTWGVTITGSANLSNNPRIESGVIFTDQRVADFNIDWIMREINNESPFKK